MTKPSDVKFDQDTTAGLSGVFGMIEYESLAHSIIDWLINNGDDWEKDFRPDDVGGSMPLFASFGTAGWLDNNYFPKGTFMVSEGFVERLSDKGKLAKPEVEDV